MNVDAVLCIQALKKGREVSIAFTDDGKAFDSVAHSWLIKVREIYKIHPTVPKFVLQLVGMWSTTLLVNNTETGDVNIKRGKQQGDTSSPKPLCLAMKQRPCC
jgi:hypothetical protein